MDAAPDDPAALLHRSLESRRIHSAYLLSGAGDAPRRAALDFVRALVCEREGARPCERCRSCTRSRDDDPVALDGTGKRGPLYRHVGDHPDLLWVERGREGTRVRIGQVRALQGALRLGANEGGWRGVVVADAEWLNAEAQNALLRLLEEPPQRTCLLLVTASAAGLLATIRSRCQRATFPTETRTALRGADASEEVVALTARFDDIQGSRLPDLLDWAEEYRGERAVAAERVQDLLRTGSEWLRERVVRRVGEGRRDARAELDAFKALSECRKDLVQRNANPQMVAERALFAVREAVAR